VSIDSRYKAEKFGRNLPGSKGGGLKMEDEMRIRIVRDIDDGPALLTEEERAHLISDLHRLLVWVGAQVPQQVHLEQSWIDDEVEGHDLSLPPEIHRDMGSIDLHQLLSRLVHQKDLNDADRAQISGIVRLLKAREMQDEQMIKQDALTHHQARQIYGEAAGIIRALLDLKDISTGRSRQFQASALRRSADDVRRWRNFLQEVEGSRP